MPGMGYAPEAPKGGPGGRSPAPGSPGGLFFVPSTVLFEYDASGLLLMDRIKQHQRGPALPTPTASGPGSTIKYQISNIQYQIFDI